MKLATILVALAFVCLAEAASARWEQLPIPTRYPGAKLGNPDAPIQIELFADFQCPSCGTAWPTVRAMLKHFGPTKVYFIFHVFPLWLHRQAFDAARAAAIVQTRAPHNYWEFTDYLFAHQSEFFNNAFYNKTEGDLVNLFGGYAQQFGVPKATFNADFEADYVYTYTDADFHFGITHQVYGTPTFYVNGVKSETLGDSTTLSQWIQFINQLLSN